MDLGLGVTGMDMDLDWEHQILWAAVEARERGEAGGVNAEESGHDEEELRWAALKRLLTDTNRRGKRGRDVLKLGEEKMSDELLETMNGGYFWQIT